ncbi:hypothetical protein DFR86_01500 [Acidianus sulfidivorans JP7]|uniref:Uncharacterized protein n=1 Tax=Acidianus sulfidivorans JP7 TaxID=619593 RepID=A0A2U9IJY7_9CREN|nr:hypothetical protein [Acidianus sulfidivorans]AWR96351.1 hypothetical protein DFR86_01500 [Acidianus sulfidivorans JP7]
MNEFIKLEKEKINNIAFFLKGFMNGHEKFESIDDIIKFIDRINKKGIESIDNIKRWEKWKLEILLKRLRFISNSFRKEQKLKNSLETKFKIKISKVIEYEQDKYVIFYTDKEGKTFTVSGTSRQIKEKLNNMIKKEREQNA